MNSTTDDYQDLRSHVIKSVDGKRLDQGLAELFPLSRRRIRRAIDEGGVYLNKKRCRTAGRKLKQGDKVRIVLLENEKLKPLTEAQLIWRKKKLFLIHKKTDQYAQEALHRSRGTLPDELARMLNLDHEQIPLLRPVHRLDRGTSGLMMLCSDPKQLQHIQANWHTCTTKKYLAVVEPAPEWEKQRITLSIDPKRDANGRFHVAEDGRNCDSEATVLERRDNRALIELIPHTGRTHQLRVHLSALGCPILGDSRYGGKRHNRLMLHAQYLKVDSPALNEPMEWIVQPEENWQW